MKSSLGQFQDDFIDALYQRPVPALAALSEQPGFSAVSYTHLTLPTNREV